MPPFDLSKIATLTGSGLSVKGYRNQASGFDPRSGDGVHDPGFRTTAPQTIAVRQPFALARRAISISSP